MVLSILVLPCKTLPQPIRPTITRQFVCSFPDDIVYFCQDIEDAYHIVPLDLRNSPSAFSFATSSFGYVGTNLPINLLINTAESPEEVD